MDKKLFEEKGSKLRKAISLLLDISAESQVESSIRSEIEECRWSEEFCTIRVGTSRRAGHSTASRSMAKEFSGTLIIATSTSEMRTISSSLCELYGDMDFLPPWNTLKNENKKRHISSDIFLTNINSLDNIRGTDQKFQAVIVPTNSSLLNQDQLLQIYRTCTPCMSDFSTRFFIFLQ